MVDDGSYSRFPWGKVAFEKLMAFISRSMNEIQKFYHLSGLPYVLQIWCYECCAKIDESLAVCVHNLIPRMVNWKMVKPKPRYEDLMDDMFNDAANVAQAVAVQQQSERTVLTEFGDKFDDFSTSPSADLLKKDEVDMKVNDFQKLMVDQYTGLLGVVKEGFASFGKVAQYPVHESEKGNLENPPQTLNEHTTDAKSYNIVDAAGQSSKLGGNEGAAEESLKVPVCKTNLKYVRKLPSKRNRQPSKVYQSPFVTYAEFLSDRHQIPSSEFDPKKHRTRYASFLWDYGVNKACTGYVSDNQDPPRPKRTFIRSEDTEMIDVEPLFSSIYCVTKGYWFLMFVEFWFFGFLMFGYF
ncbi:hypothetical protein FXO38_02697 [Capsicum annuum]|nr:hypothetical protein FXO37_33247 [Capsicum annuum]KAF3679569.1 hypothetical protein FXO38_02697 [Capsicum annuum]